MIVAGYTVYWDSPTRERIKTGKKRYEIKQYSRHFDGKLAEMKARRFAECVVSDYNPVIKEVTFYSSGS
jgi:hypothetical protein